MLCYLIVTRGDTNVQVKTKGSRQCVHSGVNIKKKAKKENEEGRVS